MKIGIAITTHNRPEVARETYAILNDMRPENSILGVVDDASFISPFMFDTPNVFRFDEQVGVGMAKNKCLELLHDAGCTHFFLFDDDCRPAVDKWWEPYINFRYDHACWTFDRKLVDYQEGFYKAFEKPNGCMMYFTRMAVNTIGGWDLDFKGYGFEHVNVSDRAFNVGLTFRRYIDVWNDGLSLFELADCETSFTAWDKKHIPANLHFYQQKYYSKEFKPFK